MKRSAVVLIATVALANVPVARACPVIVSLWDSIADADRIVVAKPVCVMRPLVEARPWMIEQAMLVNEVAAEGSGDSTPPPTREEVLARHPELFEDVPVLDHLEVEQTWKGSRVDTIRPVGGYDFLCGEDGHEVERAVVFASERPYGTWVRIPPGFARVEAAAGGRLRKVVDGALALQAKRNIAEWRILDWLAAAIEESASRLAAIQDSTWGRWLFSELAGPPSPAEAFEARHRDAIAAGFERDPGPDEVLPAMTTILCGRSPSALEALLDAVDRMLLAADSYEEDDVERIFDSVLDALWDDCDSETASRLHDVLYDYDDAIPIEDVRRLWAESRRAIANEVLDAWETGTDLVSSAGAKGE